MTETARRPVLLPADDPRVMLPRAAPQNLPDVVPDVAAAAVANRRRFAWGGLFLIAATILILLALGVAVSDLIGELFARADWLGWFGAATVLVAVLAALAVIGREMLGLMRLRRNDALRERAERVLAQDDRKEGRDLVADLMAHAGRMPRLAQARARLARHGEAIIDGADLVRLAERELMPKLDEEARRLVTGAAKRVSLVTAVSPRAAVDMLFVLVSAVMLVRRIAETYGARPGAVGMIRLLRHTLAHVALTGGMAASDTLIQQVIGQGVIAKLSARLGEGVLNGLLTARLGLAAIDVVRPMPFAALKRPSLQDLTLTLLRQTDEASAATPPAPARG